jgi:hypothetical protein
MRLRGGKLLWSTMVPVTALANISNNWLIQGGAAILMREIMEKADRASTPTMRCCGRIFDDSNLEALLEQFTQVRFDAHVG